MQQEALLKKPLEALDHAWLTEWAAHHATEAMRTGSFASLAAPLRAALSDEAACDRVGVVRAADLALLAGAATSARRRRRLGLLRRPLHAGP